MQKLGLSAILKKIFRLWQRQGIGVFWRSRQLAFGMVVARRRRQKLMKSGLLVPIGIGFSPTMRCDLTCVGCYARFYPKGDELSANEIDKFLGQAVAAGVFFFVITGGEPFKRPELFKIYQKYRRVLFLIVTNRLHLTDSLAKSFTDILRSPFLRALREHPTVLNHGQGQGCALVNNRQLFQEIAAENGAHSTEDKKPSSAD